VWANTGDTNWLHSFAYNVMFVASFSTIVFNANPLLRYDGYYILSDLLEIPNLAQRSKEYIYYLVKKYVWNVRFARNPAYSPAEEAWLFVYAIASFLMRAVVSFSIMFYLATVLNGALIVLAAGMGLAAIITWVFVPLGQFVHYLATSPELSRVRARAIATTVAFAAVIVVAVGFIPMSDHAHAQGVIEPLNMRELFAGNDGFVTEIPPLEEGQAAARPSDVLAMPRVDEATLVIKQMNPDLEAKHAADLADLKALGSQYNIAMNLEASKQRPGEEENVRAKIAAAEFQLAIDELLLSQLELKSPQKGVLIMPEMETKEYAYLKRGERVGVVADLNHLIVRAAAANTLGGPLDEEASRRVEIRVNGRSDILLSGTIVEKVAAGTNQLPSAALGYQVGGEFGTAADDRGGTKTIENFFEVRVDGLALEQAPQEMMEEYHKTHQLPLFPGQRVMVRFDLQKKSIAKQVWTSLLQLFQKKFKI